MRTIAVVGVAVIVGIAGFLPASAQKKTADGQDRADISTIDAWTIKESNAPTNQGSQVTATLNAVGIDARLSLRCENNQTKALFFLPPKLIGSQQYTRVLLRFPNGVETMLYPSPNGQSFYAGSAEQFIREFPDKGNLVIAVAGYTGRAIAGEFKLGNFSVIRQKIAQACDWASERAQNSSVRTNAMPVNTQTSAEVAKKCRALMIRAHPTEVYGPTGSAAQQRAYFAGCMSRQANMPNTKAFKHPQPTTTGSGN